MLDIIQSKIFPILSISVSLFLFLAFGYSQCQLNKSVVEIDSLKRDIENKEALLLEKEEAIQRRDQEIKYLKKSMEVLDQYDKSKDKVLKDESEAKEGILDAVSSDEESKSWWDTQVPSNILDYLTCS